LSAVVSGITSGKKCIEKLYPLKNINRYTFEIPPSLRLSPPSRKKAGWGYGRANRVSGADAPIQVSPREIIGLTISTEWVYNYVAIVPTTGQ